MTLEITSLHENQVKEYTTYDKTTLRGFKYYVDIPENFNANDLIFMHKWMEDNINLDDWFCDVNYWQSMDHNGGYDAGEHISFLLRSDEDATAFKLRWL